MNEISEEVTKELVEAAEHLLGLVSGDEVGPRGRDAVARLHKAIDAYYLREKDE